MESVNDYKRYWGAVYRDAYAEGHDFWRPELASPREFIDFLDSDLMPSPAARVLEAGCGDGLNALLLNRRGYRVTGVDVVSEAIQRARRLAEEMAVDIEFLCADLTSTIERDDTYDLWIDIKTLHTLWDSTHRERYLRNAFRALKRGGLLFVDCALALADVRDHFPHFFRSLDNALQAQADTVDRCLPPELRNGIRCDTLVSYCEEVEAAGFTVLRAGRQVGASVGWGAIIVARKPRSEDREPRSVSSTLKVKFPSVWNILRNPDEEPIYEREDRLNVQAYESEIAALELAVPRGNASARVRAIIKRYKSDCDEHVQRSAKLLRDLEGNGIPVPGVLAVLPAENTLVLEWCGDATLADMLRGDRCEIPDIWARTLIHLAGLHRALKGYECPEWRFTVAQRYEWATSGVDQWLRWFNKGEAASEELRRRVDARVKRLCEREVPEQVIWGDCNPKNIMLRKEDVFFTDFQPKRSHIMMDLILLFAFADCEATYVPRCRAHAHLAHYWQAQQFYRTEREGFEAFLDWYDDELLFRILVYGGNLLAKREARLAVWEAVVRKMEVDLLGMLTACAER